MVGVIAGQRVRKPVDGRQCHLRAVKLGDRDGPVEGDDRRGVEADQLVVEGDDLRPAMSISGLVENAAATEAMPNTVAPMSNSFLRPIRSPMVPMVTRKPAIRKP
jgi:hypothetical protein